MNQHFSAHVLEQDAYAKAAELRAQGKTVKVYMHTGVTNRVGNIEARFHVVERASVEITAEQIAAEQKITDAWTALIKAQAAYYGKPGPL